MLWNKIGDTYQHFQVPFSERRVLLVFMDTILILLASWTSFLLWDRTGGNTSGTILGGPYWYWLLSFLVGWWVLALLNDLYDIPSSYDKPLNAKRVISTGVLALAVYLFLHLLLPTYLPGRFFLYFLAFALPSIILWRLVYADLSDRLPFRHRILIIGQGERASSIAAVLYRATRLNYQVLGYIADGPTESGLERSKLPMLGHTADLPRLMQKLHAHEVVVAIEHTMEKELLQRLVDCQANGVLVSSMPDLYEKLCRCIPIQHVDPVWVLYAIQGQAFFSRLQLAKKRLLDLILVMLGLPILLLILPLLALAIRLDSKGSIFYRQIRCGRGGKPFTIIKFRTMYSDAEKDGKPRWAAKDDPRITRVGSFLRKSRLDEIPQLLNVLLGHMSIIGPRPERPEFVEQLQQELLFYRTRLMVKPGLTGWAQIHYDYGDSVEDALTKLQYDFYYIRYWSLWMDIYILFKTFWVVFKLKGT
jgi:exopolysaccharide biosynthesis polyprenyl glycosylphosphotransferase